MTLESAGILVGIAVGLTTIYALVLRPLYIFARKVTLFIENGLEVPGKVDKMQAQLTEITKEVKPNGGSSLKDAVTRIEENQFIADQKQRAWIGHSDVPAFDSDGKGVCTWANRAYLRLVGKSLEEIVGYGWINMITYADQERVFTAWNAAVKDGREFILDYQIVNAQGLPQAVHGQAFPLRDRHANVIGYLGTMESRIEARN